MIKLSWQQYDVLCEKLVEQIEGFRKSNHISKEQIELYGIPRGGTIVSNILSYMGNYRVFQNLKDYKPNGKFLIVVDDINDSGKTLRKKTDEIVDKFQSIYFFRTACLVENDWSELKSNFYGMKNSNNDWIKFPYDLEKDTISKVKER